MDITGTIQSITIPYSYHILPLVYDESLSYWQQIVVLTGKMNELIKLMNNINAEWQSADEGVLQEAKNYADEITNNLQVQFTALTNQVDAKIQELEQEQDLFIKNQKDAFQVAVNELKNQFSSTLAEMNVDMAALWTAMNYLFYQQDDYFHKIGESLKTYIDNTIAAVSGERILVNNPVTLTVTNLNKALEGVFANIQNIGAITMSEYDSILITMESYDKMDITMRDYQMRGYFIFYKELQFTEYFEDVNSRFLAVNNKLDDYIENNMIYSPWAQKKEQSYKVLQEFIDAYRVSPTFEEYNSFTSNFNEYEYYNEMELTMEEYLNQAILKYILNNISIGDGWILSTAEGNICKNHVVLTLVMNTGDKTNNAYRITVEESIFKQMFLTASAYANNIYLKDDIGTGEDVLNTAIYNHDIVVEVGDSEIGDYITLNLQFYIRREKLV